MTFATVSILSHQICRMIVSSLCWACRKYASLLFVACVHADDVHNLFIFYIFEHTISAEVEVIAGLDVCGMMNGSFGAFGLQWLHGTCDWNKMLFQVEIRVSGGLKMVFQVEKGTSCRSKWVFQFEKGTLCSVKWVFQVEKGTSHSRKYLFRSETVLSCCMRLYFQFEMPFSCCMRVVFITLLVVLGQRMVHLDLLASYQMCLCVGCRGC